MQLKKDDYKPVYLYLIKNTSQFQTWWIIRSAPCIKKNYILSINLESSWEDLLNIFETEDI